MPQPEPARQPSLAVASIAGSLWSFLAALPLCLVALLVFGPSGQDDSHITYAAAQSLADGAGIKNINGEGVEQGSSLLHVVALASVYRLSGIPLATLGTLFSLAMAIACLPATLLLARRIGIRQPWQPLLLVVFSTSFGYWSMGGLESTLVALVMLYCLFSITAFCFGQRSVAASLHLLLSLTAFLLARPEAFFVLAAALVALLAFALHEPARKKILGKAVAALGVAALLFAVICALRVHYFGQPFPQPVYAKSGNFSLQQIGFGLGYFLFAGQLSIIVYALFMTIPVYAWIKKRPANNPWLLVAICFALASLAFIVAAGGDWMGGGRFFAPIIPLLACIFCYYMQRLKYAKAVFALVLLSSVVEVAIFSRTLSTGVPLYQVEGFKASFLHQPEWNSYSWAEAANYIHARDLQLIDAMQPVIVALLAGTADKANPDGQQKPLVIASIQMGMIPYHLHRQFGDALYFVDMRGLTTRHISGCAEFDDAKKIWTGIYISYREYLEAWQKGVQKGAQKGACQLPQPDIIYDVLNRSEAENRERLDTLAENNYRIVYRQQGKIKGPGSNKQIDGSMFIAVRNGLLQHLPENLRSRQILFANKKGNM